MQQVTSKALPLDNLSGAVSTYDQNSSDFLYHICMSPVVFDTKNVDITNPKTWPGPVNGTTLQYPAIKKLFLVSADT